MGVYEQFIGKDKKKKTQTGTPITTITTKIPNYENYVNNVVSGASGIDAGSGAVSGSSGGAVDAGTGTPGGQGYYQKMIENYDKQRQDAINQAQTQRQRSQREAEGLYSRSLASYGRNAEQLSQMGLTGSGYSDYVRSAAAAQRAAGGLAADATYNSAVKEANNAYNEKENALKQESYLAWLEAREGAIDGTISKDKLNLYAEQYGFTEEQKAGLDSTLKETEAEATLDNISNGIIDFTAIADKYKGNESSEEYLNVKAEVNKNVDTGTSFFKDEAGNQMSYSAAQKQYQAAIDSGIFDDSKLKEIKATFDRNYTVTLKSTTDLWAKPSMDVMIEASEIEGYEDNYLNRYAVAIARNELKANNFKLTMPNGDTCNIQLTTGEPLKLDIQANNGEVVAHSGKIYLKYKDYFWELGAQDRGVNEEDWITLTNHLFN